MSSRYFVAFGALTLAGCGANFNSVYRSDNIKGEEVIISQDAKQRIVFVRKQGGDGNAKSIACTEPSPDALSVFASSLQGNFTTPEQVAAAFGSATAESGASIGLRTQSIQLIRDQGYRICEGYANGALDELDYRQLLRRNQVFTTAILAIEQLTGAVAAQQVAIGSNSYVGAAKELASAQKYLDDKSSELESLQADAKLKQDALNRANSDLGPIASAKEGDVIGGKTITKEMIGEAKAKIEKASAESKAADAKVGEVRQELADLEKNRDAMRSALGAGSTPAQFAKVGPSNTVDTGEVSGAVRDIVMAAYNKTFFTDFCQMYWANTLNRMQYDRSQFQPTDVERKRFNEIDGMCLEAFRHVFRMDLAPLNLDIQGNPIPGQAQSNTPSSSASRSGNRGRGAGAEAPQLPSNLLPSRSPSQTGS